MCKWVVLQGRGRRGGGRAGGGGGRSGRQRRRRGVPETAAAAAAGVGGGSGGGRELGSLAEQQQLLAGDLAIGRLGARRAGVVLAANGGAERVRVGAALLSRFPERGEQTHTCHNQISNYSNFRKGIIKNSVICAYEMSPFL